MAQIAMQSSVPIVITDGLQESEVSELWENSYPRSKFLMQLSFMVITGVLWVLLVRRCVAELTVSWVPAVSFVCSMLFLDWVSGMMHWACDSWGAFKTPVVGPTLIRSFRMHHVDPLDITRHGFVETNASSCYPMPPLILAALCCQGGTLFTIYQWTILFGCMLGLFTNEIHKWAHMVHEQPNPLVLWLQHTGIILNPAKHHIHHIDNFDRNYCITNGWMNPLLQAIHYWRILQYLITALTGAVPRADDSFWRQLKPKS